MNLTDLQPTEGATHRKKRIGRGIGSGWGKTCGKGTKGDKSRGQVRPGFEGGQTPLHRRLPHFRGFTQPFKKEWQIINLGDIENRFEAGETVDPEILLQKHVIGEFKDGVKILGKGDFTKKLTIRAHSFSKGAEEKITALGGVAEKI
jgi:large subunit ribosomal protein L15